MLELFFFEKSLSRNLSNYGNKGVLNSKEIKRLYQGQNVVKLLIQQLMFLFLLIIKSYYSRLFFPWLFLVQTSV